MVKKLPQEFYAEVETSNCVGVYMTDVLFIMRGIQCALITV